MKSGEGSGVMGWGEVVVMGWGEEVVVMGWGEDK